MWNTLNSEQHLSYGHQATQARPREIGKKIKQSLDNEFRTGVHCLGRDT